MRAFFSLFSLVALATTGVFSTPVPECLSEICGTVPLLNSGPSGPADFAASIAKVGTPTRSLPEPDVERLTNAERFVRGLPPKRPKHLPGSPSRRTEPSPVPLTTFRGMIRVDKADGSGTLGYLSAHPLNGAQERYQSMENAAIVTFKFDDSQTVGPASEMTSTNSDTPFKTLGLVQGRDDTNSDLNPGSYHYLYVSETNATPSGSPPANVGNAYTSATGTSRTSESEVWTFNSETQEITLQWINTDGSAPPTKLFTQSTALYAGADPSAFLARYPSPVIVVKYFFIPL